MEKYRTFDDCYEFISKEIDRRRIKWTLDSVPYICYDDVKNIILNHVYKKWALYDQSRPLKSWLAALIQNQITNLLRNNWKNYAKVCNSCAAAREDDGCLVYGTQDPNLCPLLKKWTKTKANAYNVKIPVSMELHTNEVNEKSYNPKNIDDGIRNFSNELEKKLSNIDFLIYKMSFLEHKTDREIFIILRETPNKLSFKKIKDTKKAIIEYGKKIIYSDEIDF